MPNLKVLGKVVSERGNTEQPHWELERGCRAERDLNWNMQDLTFPTQTSSWGGRDGEWLILP